MPCDSISLVSVEWSLKHTDLTLLAAALNALGKSAQVVGEQVVFPGGKFAQGRFAYESTYYSSISAEEAGKRVAEIKRAYSAEAVKSQAKKWGWTLKETAPYQYEVVKR